MHQLEFHRFYKYVFFILFLNIFGYSQEAISYEKIDSLSYLDYEILNKYINFKDTVKTKILINAYLKKGKREQDSIRQARAYRVLFVLDRGKANNTYADSIIYISKNVKHKDYPATGYFLKAIQLYGAGNYKSALDYFFKAKNHTFGDQPDIERYIGIIKTRLGYYDDALIAYKKSLDLYKKTDNIDGILESYYALSDVTRFLKQTDSSLYYCKLGYDLASEINKKDHLAYFLFNKGATLSDMKMYESSQEHLIEALPEIIKVKDKPNTAICHFFIGRNYKNLNDTTKALYHLKQMDSIFLNTNDLNPELREGYGILINHYKKKGDLKRQLDYVERMLLVDSIINKNYNYLDRTLIKNYSRTQLESERKRLNNDIASIKNRASNKIAIGIFIISILLILLFLKHYKHKKDIGKFERLINKTQVKKETDDSVNQCEIDDLNNKPILDLSDSVKNELIAKLNLFEHNNEFLNSDLTREILSKKIDTNVKYLSKIINHHKGKTYINYINDLRVDYAIEQLQEVDGEFIKWSVKAIAKEVGFNYTEPFSKAFFKRTGIKPSFFIRNLKKNTLNS